MGQRASLVASASLCLSLACLRCGVWRDGSPGPSTSPEQYWTASMAQATGYGRAELRPVLEQLSSLHQHASSSLAANPLGQPAEPESRWANVRVKFSHPRFLGVLKVAPFRPHMGGALYSPLHADLVRAPTAPPTSPVGAAGLGL